MILKISVQLFLCTLMISKVSSLSVTDKTWYQEEAILKVLNGIFTVELVHNNSAPKSLNADGKGIVELNRGFARISSLERLSLEDNFIEIIDGSVFEGLPGLVYLSLARNRIKYLERDSFQGLNKLEILNLDYNFLNKFKDSINDNILPALKQLYLQCNQLTYIHPYQIDLCHSGLERLYLANNSIYSFSEGNPFCLNNLTHLYLENNELVKFSIGKMPLEVLSLDGNSIDNIPTINSKLRFLSLARNKIKSFRYWLFDNATNLVTLVLSYNQFTFYSNQDRFINLPSLEHLILDHNSINAGSMRLDLFDDLELLRSLDLTGNMINTDDSLKKLAHLPNLERLHLGNNSIDSFPGNETFANSKLNYLDLSNNKVSKISRLQLNTIPELKVLVLTGNPLRRSDEYSMPNQLTILF